MEQSTEQVQLQDAGNNLNKIIEVFWAIIPNLTQDYRVTWMKNEKYFFQGRGVFTIYIMVKSTTISFKQLRQD